MSKRREVRMPLLEPALMDDLYIQYKAFLKPFGRNIRALRVYCGLSTVFVVKDLLIKYNFKTSRECIQSIEINKPHRYYTVSLFYLHFIALYWDIPLNSLLVEDFTIEANLPDHIKVRKKLNKAVLAANIRFDRPIERKIDYSHIFPLNQLPVSSIGSIPVQP